MGVVTGARVDKHLKSHAGNENMLDSQLESDTAIAQLLTALTDLDNCSLLYVRNMKVIEICNVTDPQAKICKSNKTKL